MSIEQSLTDRPSKEPEEKKASTETVEEAAAAAVKEAKNWVDGLLHEDVNRGILKGVKNIPDTVKQRYEIPM